MILSFAILLTFFLGFFTYLKNPKSATNMLFFIFSIAICSYNLFNFFSLNQSSGYVSLIWVRLIMAVAVFINLLFFLLTQSFPHTQMKLNRYIFWLIFIFSAWLIPLTQTPFIFRDVMIFGSKIEPVPGVGIPFIGLHTFLLLGAGFLNLVIKLRKSRGVEKVQIKLFLLGAILLLVSIIITNFIIIVLFKITTFANLLPLYTLIFVGLLSYSIVRHRFLDIRMILARSVTFTMLLFILGFVYASGIFIAGNYFFGNSNPTLNLLTSVTLALVMAFSFQPLQNLLQKVTDSILYKGAYDTDKLLASMSKIMTSTIDLNDITSQLLHELLHLMNIEYGCLMLTRENSIIWFKGSYTDGQKNPEFDEKEVNQLLEQSLQKQNILIIDEIEEEKYKKIMMKYDFSIVLPLIVDDALIGGIMLGQKSSGDIYSVIDINVLKILAPEIAIAVKNSLSYEEIKRFNITLEQEIKTATFQLRDANEKLKDLDKLKDDFVSVASHELRTPMTAIKSYLWMALDGRGGALSEKQKFYLDRAYNSTDRLIKLVNDMLNISRIESGRMTYDMEKTDLAQLVNEVIADVKPRAEELDVSIKYQESSIKNQIPAVLADKDKIKEVLFNLIGNSLKFTPKGGEIRVEILRKEDTLVECSVIDTGAGISAEDMEKLFQKFGLLTGSYTINKSDQQGTGLGLYITKSIVEAHGGAISVYSAGVGKGAKFTFTLPIFTQKSFEEHHEKQEGKEKIGLIHTAM